MLKRNYNFYHALILSAFVALVGSLWADFDASRGETALHVFRPLIEVLNSLGAYFYSFNERWRVVVFASVVGVLCLLLFMQDSRNRRLLVLAVIAAVLGQFLLTYRTLLDWLSQVVGIAGPAGGAESAASFRFSLWGGVIAYLGAAVLFLRATRGSHEDIGYDRGRKEAGEFSIRDMLIVLAILGVALLFRVYALNTLFSVFEGELSHFAAAGSSIKGMFVANKGIGGPWSPLGILYYVPIYLTTKLVGTTLLSLRLSSVVIGIITIPCIYLLASRLAGRVAGHLAAALFALNTLFIGWGRSDVHPHGSTTWPTLLLCFALIKAFDTQKWSWFTAVVALMTLAWHQYPSGQSAVAIPLIAIGLYWLSNRRQLPFSAPVCAFISFGVILWYLGLPVSYMVADGNFEVRNPFNLTGPRASWSQDQVPNSVFAGALIVAQKALGHVGDVFQGLFYKQPYLCHQEWLPKLGNSYTRSVPWLEMPFVFLGFVMLWRSRMRFESLVMVAWIIAALAPGVLSERAYPKRLSTFYPAIDILCAMSVATLLLQLKEMRVWMKGVLIAGACLAAVCYGAINSYYWFSGNGWKQGEPVEVSLAQKLAGKINKDTLVISHIQQGNDEGKYTYLLIDHLSAPLNRPNGWLTLTGEEFNRLLKRPLEFQDFARRDIPYQWTKLRDQLQETVEYKGWKRVLFVIHPMQPNRTPNEQQIQSVMQRCRNPVSETFEAPPWVANSLLTIECAVGDLVE